MYVKRIQLLNYGPIDHIDLELPFDEERPKPVLLIGENGSGKSILLSHIVNGLISAKDRTYPHSPEVETGRVYKLRSSSYIKLEKEFYFSRVDFEGDLFISEIRTRSNKEELQETPLEIKGGPAEEAWSGIPAGSNDHTVSTLQTSNDQQLRDLFSGNCVLYFPPNRFEEPAWLNEENLTSRAEYMGLKNIVGHTERKVINYSPLHENQNWLFDVVYDSRALEIRTGNVDFPVQAGLSIPLTIFKGYSGEATKSYETALEVLRNIFDRGPNTRFGIGTRRNRVVSIMVGEQTVVPNIFQLSTGETALLNLFLSILRDYELSGASFSSTQDVRGIVVVDEIDLHLHVSHQYSILPNLLKMFPNVQFIVTTHSPLFILGMRNGFGEGGFALYRMPEGDEIDPEEFSEFEEAYSSFSETSRFLKEVQSAIAEATKPIVFVEGVTDKRYIEKAAELLDRQFTLDKVELRSGGGFGNLDTVWNTPELVGGRSKRVGLLYDCDKVRALKENEAFTRQSLPLREDNSIKTGIENLFGVETIAKAQNYKPAFIDIRQAHKQTIRGHSELVPEKWTVNSNEKTNLCNWLCENGTGEDFKNFGIVFEMIESMLDTTEDLEQ